MLETFVKLVTVPSIKVRSSTVKSVDGSLRVKVIAAVSPALRAALLLVIDTVGATVSILIDVASAPAVFPFPTESLKTLAATEIDPGAVELAVGVKMTE